MATTVKWASTVSADDLADANAFLRLRGMSVDWSRAISLQVPVKDILRAGLSTALPTTNAGVKKYLEKIKNGEAIGPILLVSGTRAIPALVAEGYHRVSACYSLDEKMLVTVRFVEFL